MKDKSKKSTYSTTFGVDPKKAANAKMAICCFTKTYPRPHVESNHDLAFRKRPFYPLNYRGGIKKA